MSQAPPPRPDAAAPQSSAPRLNLQRLEKLRRLLQYGATAVLVVFVGLIALSGYKLKQINDDIEVKKGEMRAKQLELQTADELLAQKKREYDVLDRQWKVASEALQSLSRKNPAQASEVKEAVEQAVERTAERTPDQSTIPPRIYIHIAREEQRERARGVTRALQAGGYVVPGIENVGDKSPRASQLRHFRNSSEPRDIEDITGQLRKIGVRVSVPPESRGANVRPRHYELWFGEDF